MAKKTYGVNTFVAKKHTKRRFRKAPYHHRKKKTPSMFRMGISR